VCPVVVIERFEFAQGVQKVAWFRMRVRSSSSVRQVRTHRSMIAFIRARSNAPDLLD
jgi:hypothetical protein